MDNKIVDHKIKDFFEPRTIHPSTQSWDRLDAMLSVAETQKKKKSPVYLMVAASLAPILVISIWFIFKNDIQKIKTDNSLVETRSYKIESKVDPKTAIIPGPELKVEAKNTSIVENNDNQSFTTISPSIKDKHNRPKSKINVKLTSPTSLNNLNSENTTEKSISINDDHATVKNSAPNIGQVETTEYTAKNIEREIESKVSHKKDAGLRHKYGLDPEKLLREAEYASQQSFLSKVFKTLTEKSETVVTAVSQRNEVKPK